MTLKENYQFEPTDFDCDGFHKVKDEYLFLNLIRENEMDFHWKHEPYFANTFLANGNTMHLLKMCFSDRGDEVLGMESVDGDVDIEMNLKIEEHSDRATVYAIERFHDSDEPLFMVVDDKCSNREFILEYSPDNDSGKTSEDVPVPVSKTTRPVAVLR